MRKKRAELEVMSGKSSVTASSVQESTICVTVFIWSAVSLNGGAHNPR